MIPKYYQGYALITAAHNEEKYIGPCIASVLSQSIRPRRWVIVSDGSTDETDNIISKYTKIYPIIQFIRKEHDPEMKGFASKVCAINMGVEALKGMDYQLIGHLDADITLRKDYYETMINIFNDNPHLGITGGYISEKVKGSFKSRSANSPWSVSGGIQLFRRECYQDIGGLRPMPLGGEDWHAEILARMHGWHVISFPEIPVYHHKNSRNKRGRIKEAIREGAMDYSMGAHPIFEIFKCARRVKESPYFIFAIIRMYGFLKPYLMKTQRQVKKEEMQFLRLEQISRIKKVFSVCR